MRKKYAFTLIELLIVVAIIAILAAIAVPNFLEAQTRSKVSRVKADIRSFATALEAYATDYNKFPFDCLAANGMSPGATYSWFISHAITTPVSYMTNNMIIDPFRTKGVANLPMYRRFRYVNYALGQFNSTNGAAVDPAAYVLGEPIYGSWRLSSSGPDYSAGPWEPLSTWPATGTNFTRGLMVYDATNGTISKGDIVRSQKMSEHNQPPLLP